MQIGEKATTNVSSIRRRKPSLPILPWGIQVSSDSSLLGACNNGGGGLQNGMGGGGGQEKLYPYKKGGQNKLSHAEVVGQNTYLGSFFLLKLEVLAILKGGVKSFHPLKGGTKFYPLLRGGCKKFWTSDFPIL